ncbi:hypothetical protein Tco_1406969 [Tanacetum coccineum]
MRFDFPSASLSWDITTLQHTILLPGASCGMGTPPVCGVILEQMEYSLPRFGGGPALMFSAPSGGAI